MEYQASDELKNGVKNSIIRAKNTEARVRNTESGVMNFKTGVKNTGGGVFGLDYGSGKTG